VCLGLGTSGAGLGETGYLALDDRRERAGAKSDWVSGRGKAKGPERVI